MTTVGSRLWELLAHQVGQDQGTLQLVFGGVSDALLRGERLTVPDFGTFTMKDCPATVKWQPKAGEKRDVPARRRLQFRAATAFRREARS